MSKGLHDFVDYREYLAYRIKAEKGIRGIKNALAKAAGCHPSYLSTSLKGRTELTPDHAAGIAQFFAHSQAETEYFILLVHLARAGTVRLKGFIKQRLESLRAEASDINRRLNTKVTPSAETAAFYYSSWIIGAIHVAISIESLQTVPALSRRFALPEKYVQACLRQLEEMKLVERQDDRWVIRQTQIHLPPDSPFILAHHANWRNQALARMLHKGDYTLHYSGVHTLSEETARLLMKRFGDTLLEATEKIRLSKEETIYCLNLDWFEL